MLNGKIRQNQSVVKKGFIMIGVERNPRYALDMKTLAYKSLSYEIFTSTYNKTEPIGLNQTRDNKTSQTNNRY